MAKTALTRMLRDRLAEFRGAGGNVAITFALALVPLVYAIGSAVDYSRANSIKAALQAAVDATALAMSTNATTLNANDLQNQATAYFKAVFNRPEAQNTTVTPVYTASSSTLVVSGSAMMKTDFLGLMGFSKLNISTTSTVSWGTTKLQVALVLDNTGSMNDAGKIAALKTASHQLLTTLQNAAHTPGDVQVAIIPFNTDVNVGTGNVNASWLKWSWSNATGTGSSTSYSSCVAGWCWNGSTLVFVGGPVTVSKTGWTGCVTDRDQSYDVGNTAPDVSNVATLFPADMPLLGCPAQLMPLGNDWTALNSRIDQMVAAGETNQAIGLAWGWQALTQGAPLSAPAAESGTQKVIILLTDGLNTADRWVNVLFGAGTASTIDARQQLLCNNIKAAGITLYTVQVNTGSDPTSTLLQNCASDSNKFFLLRTSGEIVTTFNSIGTNLAKLRIAK